MSLDRLQTGSSNLNPARGEACAIIAANCFAETKSSTCMHYNGHIRRSNQHKTTTTSRSRRRRYFHFPKCCHNDLADLLAYKLHNEPPPKDQKPKQ